MCPRRAWTNAALNNRRIVRVVLNPFARRGTYYRHVAKMMAFWRASLAAWHAARAAVVFQRGHNHREYALALPDLTDYYSQLRRVSDIPFSVQTAARLELDWWMVHRDVPRILQAICSRRSRLYKLRSTSAPERLFQNWQTIGSLLDGDSAANPSEARTGFSTLSAAL